MRYHHRLCLFLILASPSCCCLSCAFSSISTKVDAILSKLIVFYADMVDTDTSRFFYSCYPPTGERLHQQMPIRDLAAAWDATKALSQLSTLQQQSENFNNMRQLLIDAACNTLEAHGGSYASAGCGVALDPKMLREPSTIAHSALMLMTTTNIMRLSLTSQEEVQLSKTPPIHGLVNGILSVQRPNGAFQTEFGIDIDDDEGIFRNINFYPGEAMLAMLDAYQLSEKIDGILDASTRDAIITSMERAYIFYYDYYKEQHPDVNFNIWQIQASAKFVDILCCIGRTEEAKLISGNIMQMCSDIINSKAWKYELSRGRSFYSNINTVEIACGLDSIVDGIPIASMVGVNTNEEVDALASLKRNARNAIDFIEWSQEQVPEDYRAGYGGLGFGGTHVLEQRLDVTGHALSAFSKLRCYRIMDDL